MKKLNTFIVEGIITWMIRIIDSETGQKSLRVEIKQKDDDQTEEYLFIAEITGKLVAECYKKCAAGQNVRLLGKNVGRKINGRYESLILVDQIEREA